MDESKFKLKQKEVNSPTQKKKQTKCDPPRQPTRKRPSAICLYFPDLLWAYAFKAWHYCIYSGMQKHLLTWKVFLMRGCVHQGDQRHHWGGVTTSNHLEGLRLSSNWNANKQTWNTYSGFLPVRVLKFQEIFCESESLHLGCLQRGLETFGIPQNHTKPPKPFQCHQLSPSYCDPPNIWSLTSGPSSWRQVTNVDNRLKKAIGNLTCTVTITIHVCFCMGKISARHRTVHAFVPWRGAIIARSWTAFMK